MVSQTAALVLAAIIGVCVASYGGSHGSSHGHSTHQHSYVEKSWGEWGYWSACSKPCGNGRQSRSRSCESKTVYGYGKDSGDCYEGQTDTEYRHCNTHCCAVDGGYGPWSTWAKVSHGYSHSSHGYSESRSRECNYPKPSCGGKYCYGESSQTRRRHAYPSYGNGYASHGNSYSGSTGHRRLYGGYRQYSY